MRISLKSLVAHQHQHYHDSTTNSFHSILYPPFLWEVCGGSRPRTRNTSRSTPTSDSSDASNQATRPGPWSTSGTLPHAKQCCHKNICGHCMYGAQDVQEAYGKARQLNKPNIKQRKILSKIEHNKTVKIWGVTSYIIPLDSLNYFSNERYWSVGHEVVFHVLGPEVKIWLHQLSIQVLVWWQSLINSTLIFAKSNQRLKFFTISSCITSTLKSLSAIIFTFSRDARHLLCILINFFTGQSQVKQQ